MSVYTNVRPYKRTYVTKEATSSRLSGLRHRRHAWAPSRLTSAPRAATARSAPRGKLAGKLAQQHIKMRDMHASYVQGVKIASWEGQQRRPKLATVWAHVMPSSQVNSGPLPTFPAHGDSRMRIHPHTQLCSPAGHTTDARCDVGGAEVQAESKNSGCQLSYALSFQAVLATDATAVTHAPLQRAFSWLS